MKLYFRLTFFFFLASIKILQAQDKPIIGETPVQLVVDNIPRNFIVYIPKCYSSSKKLPVIVLFHGGGGKPRFVLNISSKRDFKSISEEKGIILIAPEGIKKSWNDGRQTKSNKMNVDDVKFVSQILDYLPSHYADTLRVFAVGISNGGFMVSRLGCEIGYKFAAIAVVAATMGTDTPYSSCMPSFTLPVMYIHGTDDSIIPIIGAQKTIGAEGAFVSHQQVIDKWISINKCNPVPVKRQLPDIDDDKTTITKSEYDNGINNAKVISYIVHGGGHTWPGGKQYLPKFLVGRVSKDMNACEVIWKFFDEN